MRFWFYSSAGVSVSFSLQWRASVFEFVFVLLVGSDCAQVKAWHGEKSYLISINLINCAQDMTSLFIDRQPPPPPPTLQSQCSKVRGCIPRGRTQRRLVYPDKSSSSYL